MFEGTLKKWYYLTNFNIGGGKCYVVLANSQCLRKSWVVAAGSNP